MIPVRRIIFIFTIFCLSTQALEMNYGHLMASKVRAALGSKANGYTFSTYPVDNFGLATAYNGKQGPASEICATWDCIGVSDQNKVSELTDFQRLWLVVGGIQYAEAGAGGALKLTEDEKRSLGLNALLPKVLEALSLSADASAVKDVNTDLELGPVTIRILRRQQMLTHLNGSDGHPLEKEAFADKHLVLVYSDIVLKTMKIHLTVNADSNADLQAKLDGALSGNVGKVIGTGSSLSFKVDKATKGDYTLETTTPTILATYARRQPTAKTLGPVDDKWSSWPAFELGEANMTLKTVVNLGDIQ